MKIGKLIKGAVVSGYDLAKTPIPLLKDSLTLGGKLSNKGRSYTYNHIQKIKNNFED